MQMTEVMMCGRVQFDKRVIRAQHISKVEETRSTFVPADVAYVCQRSVELRAAIELFLIRPLHIFGAPSEVPNRRSQFPRRRRADLIEKQPGFLSPHRVHHSGESTFFAVKLARVEINRRRGIDHVQMKMMEVSDRSRCCSLLRLSLVVTGNTDAHTAQSNRRKQRHCKNAFPRSKFDRCGFDHGNS